MERFKETNSPVDSIHAKFSSKTGLPVVGDKEWGHLQIDAISLYLLTVAQMTASGLQVIYSLNEVRTFILCILKNRRLYLNLRAIVIIHAATFYFFQTYYR